MAIPIPNSVSRHAAKQVAQSEADVRKRIESIAVDDTGFDTRNVLNLAPGKRLPVDVEAMVQKGVTLEQLAALPVPVRYFKTQVTLHGLAPDGLKRGRCNAAKGYQTFIRNGNGSLGVRWVAVDAEKKHTLERAVRLTPDGLWAPYWNSTGFGLQVGFPLDKAAEFVDLARAIPRSAFVGTVSLGRIPFYGMGFIDVSIAAIPAGSLWGLVRHFSGFASASELQQAEDEAEARYEAERAKSQAAARAAEAKLKARADEAKAKAREIGLEHGLAVVDSPGPGHFVQVKQDSRGAWYFVHAELSKSFGRLVRRGIRYATMAEANAAALEGKRPAGKGRELLPGGLYFRPSRSLEPATCAH